MLSYFLGSLTVKLLPQLSKQRETLLYISHCIFTTGTNFASLLHLSLILILISSSLFYYKQLWQTPLIVLGSAKIHMIKFNTQTCQLAASVSISCRTETLELSLVSNALISSALNTYNLASALSLKIMSYSSIHCHYRSIILLQCYFYHAVFLTHSVLYYPHCHPLSRFPQCQTLAILEDRAQMTLF